MSRKIRCCGAESTASGEDSDMYRASEEDSAFTSADEEEMMKEWREMERALEEPEVSDGDEFLRLEEADLELDEDDLLNLDEEDLLNLDEDDLLNLDEDDLLNLDEVAEEKLPGPCSSDADERKEEMVSQEDCEAAGCGIGYTTWKNARKAFKVLSIKEEEHQEDKDAFWMKTGEDLTESEGAAYDNEMEVQKEPEEKKSEVDHEEYEKMWKSMAEYQKKEEEYAAKKKEIKEKEDPEDELKSEDVKKGAMGRVDKKEGCIMIEVEVTEEYKKEVEMELGLSDDDKPSIDDETYIRMWNEMAECYIKCREEEENADKMEDMKGKENAEVVSWVTDAAKKEEIKDMKDEKKTEIENEENSEDVKNEAMGEFGMLNDDGKIKAGVKRDVEKEEEIEHVCEEDEKSENGDESYARMWDDMAECYIKCREEVAYAHNRKYMKGEVNKGFYINEEIDDVELPDDDTEDTSSTSVSDEDRSEENDEEFSSEVYNWELKNAQYMQSFDELREHLKEKLEEEEREAARVEKEKEEREASRVEKGQEEREASRVEKEKDKEASRVKKEEEKGASRVEKEKVKEGSQDDEKEEIEERGDPEVGVSEENGHGVD